MSFSTFSLLVFNLHCSAYCFNVFTSSIVNPEICAACSIDKPKDKAFLAALVRSSAYPFSKLIFFAFSKSIRPFSFGRISLRVSGAANALSYASLASLYTSSFVYIL